MRSGPLPVVVVVLVAGALSSAPARAQELDPRVFEPTLSALGVLGVDSSATAHHLQPWGKVDLSLADDELISETDTQQVARGALDSRVVATFAAGLGVLDRFEVAVGLPVAVTRGALAPDGATGVNDLRLALRGRILGPATRGRSGLGVALALHLTLPTGSDDAFMSDGAATAMPRAVLDYRTRHGLVVALDVGARFRPERRFEDLVIGDELRIGLGAEVPLGFYGISFLAELDAALSLASSPGDGGGLSAREAPVEALAGLRWRPSIGLMMSAAVGGGVTEGYGAPDFRVLFGVAINVSPPPPYEEPIVPASMNEPRDDWERGPVPLGPPGPRPEPRQFDALALADPDADGDGVPIDQSADVIGVPPRLADLCSSIPEDRDGFEDDDGCPDPDDDGDGVLDADDRCPDELETLNGNEDFDGCFDHPKPIIGQGIDNGRVLMRDRVEFAANSDELLDSDKRILDQVVVVIRANPDIKRFRIEGHTDNYGDKERNVDLSERRAGRVREYLIAQGIDENRLFPKGFGPTRPVARNRTKAGRAMNRRVEIHVVPPGEPDEGALP